MQSVYHFVCRPVGPDVHCGSGPSRRYRYAHRTGMCFICLSVCLCLCLLLCAAVGCDSQPYHPSSLTCKSPVQLTVVFLVSVRLFAGVSRVPLSIRTLPSVCGRRSSSSVQRTPPPPGASVAVYVFFRCVFVSSLVFLSKLVLFLSYEVLVGHVFGNALGVCVCVCVCACASTACTDSRALGIRSPSCHRANRRAPVRHPHRQRAPRLHSDRG